MKDILETLFFPLQSGAADIRAGRVLFLNAQDHRFLDGFANLDVLQHFKPYADVLAGRVRNVLDKPAGNAYDGAMVLIPKNMIEARFIMAQAIMALRDGGILVCAADNKAGGTRLKKMLLDFGIKDVQEDSRNKARVVWAVVRDRDQARIDEASQEGKKQEILGGSFVSQPGIFGWDRVDKGSEVLAGCLPRDLKGQGADFGCGYGYLARYVLGQCPKVSKIICIDADQRAVRVCEDNLQAFSGRTEFLWLNLKESSKNLEGLDFIVMNPPFHEGKNTDIEIGARFIQTASAALRKSGILWMVANAHLPYESILSHSFVSCVKVFEGQGFKVYRAIK